MNFTIKSNAADSLRRSVTYFAENTSSGLKAAVKELVSALELYVKEQLVQLDLNPLAPVLVYERFAVDINRTDGRYELKPLGEKTVRFEDALERLVWLGHPIAAADASQLRSLKKIRNKIEHFSVAEAPAHVRSLYAAATGFAIRYLYAYHNQDFFEIVNGDEWRRCLAVDPAIRAATELSVRQIYVHLTDVADRATGTAICAKCSATIMVEATGYYQVFRCITCGFRHDVDECYMCKKSFFVGLLYPADGDTAFCEDCNKLA